MLFDAALPAVIRLAMNTAPAGVSGAFSASLTGGE
jgi:hypothetical protein